MDLNRLPRDGLFGIDRRKVENDRKEYWESFYAKYEDLNEKCTKTFGLDEIDQPKCIQEELLDLENVSVLKPDSRTVKKWISDHGEVIDELTTIAGPPSIDEDELSDEEVICSDEELDENELSENDSIEPIEVCIPETFAQDGEVDVKIKPLAHSYLNLDLSPKSSEECEEIASLIHEESAVLNELSPASSPLLKTVDSDDSDCILYSADMPTAKKSIFATEAAASKSIFSSKSILFSPSLSSSKNNSVIQPEIVSTSYLECSSCAKETDYSTNLGLVENSFKCDMCLLNDSHSDCGEVCDKCPEIAAAIDARRIHREMVLNSSNSIQLHTVCDIE